MSHVHGFKTVHDDDVAEVLKATKFQFPLERIVQADICSFEESFVPYKRYRDVGLPYWPGASVSPIRLGRFRLRCGGRDEEVRGLLRLRAPENFARWAPRNLVLAPGTSPWRWLRAATGEEPSGGWDKKTRRQLRRLEDRLSCPAFAPGEDTAVNDLPGVYVTGPGGCHEFSRIETPSGQMLAKTSEGGVEFRLSKRPALGRHRVPIMVRLRVADSGRCAFFDGRSFGVREQLTALPRRLSSLLDTRGTAYAPSDVAMRPLSDLQPRFLLKVPSKRSLNAAGGAAPNPPDIADRPAILLRSTEPIALLDDDGQLRDLPIIDEPGEAAAVLVRCPERHVYVPSATPLDVRDLRLRGSQWLVGCELGGMPS